MWNEWKKRKQKQLYQFNDKNMSGDSIELLLLPRNAVILHPN